MWRGRERERETERERVCVWGHIFICIYIYIYIYVKINVCVCVCMRGRVCKYEKNVYMPASSFWGEAASLPEELVEKAKKCGIDVNRKKKAFKVKLHDFERTFSWSFQSGMTPEAAFELAHGSWQLLQESCKSTCTWDGKRCNAYMDEHGLKGKNSRVLLKQEICAAHSWLA